MDFQDQKAIYLQIAAFVEEQILMKAWQGRRIPAVRELAGLLKVNPNTVMRAYAYLDSQAIIASERGVGYFITEGAEQKIIALRKAVFLEDTVPEFIKQMKLLGIGWEEVIPIQGANINY